MNRPAVAIVISVIAMVIVLYVFDIAKFVVTPLSSYGANHWIPEALAIFLVGRSLSQREQRLKISLILLCLFIYAPLTYGLMYRLAGVVNGIGTSCFFVAVFLMGVWSANR